MSLGAQVLLEGIDVKDLRQASLRSAVAVVPQDTVLFNETILANIAYGRPGASREEIIRAAGTAMPSAWIWQCIGCAPACSDSSTMKQVLPLEADSSLSSIDHTDVACKLFHSKVAAGCS